MQRAFFIALVSAVLAVSGRGQDPKTLANTSEPGPEHEHLKAFVGKWELTIEGVKEKGKAEFKSILGGRFLIEDTMLPFGDFSMEWHGIYGYDRVKKQYTGIWVDNMNNTTESGSGEADKTGRILSFRGEQVGPSGGKAKFLWRISNDGKNAMTIEMFEVAKDGNETLTMSVRGEKQK